MKTPRVLDRRRWLRSRESVWRAEQGWDAEADGATAWTRTRRRPHLTECLAHGV